MAQLAAPEFQDDTTEGSPTKGATRGNTAKKARYASSGTTRGIAEVRPLSARATGARPFLGENDLVMVENLDDVSWRFEWDKRAYDVSPGQHPMPVPFPAVVNAMGDPRSAKGMELSFRAEDGTSGMIESRHNSIVRLFARYQITNEDVDALVDFAPKLRVTTMQGDAIIFPAQNPNHEPWPVPNTPEPGREAPISVTEAVSEARAENALLREQMAHLQRLVDDRLGTAAAPAAEPEAADLGGAVPDSGPRARI
jgi:hypothetical protein